MIYNIFLQRIIPKHVRPRTIINIVYGQLNQFKVVQSEDGRQAGGGMKEEA